MNLIRAIRQKPLEYFILLLIFSIAAFLFIFYRSDHFIQRRIIYGSSATYFLWSLYHHYRQGDLHLSIIIEYLLFIVLALIVTAATLF